MDDFIGRYRFDDIGACKRIIEWFEANEKEPKQGIIFRANGEPYVNLEANNGQHYHMPCNTAYQENPDFAKFLTFLWDSVQAYINKYKELNNMSFSMMEDLMVVRFSPPDGGFKVLHAERVDLPSSSRMLVWMMYLTDHGPEVGGTRFKYYNHQEQAEAGKLLIWPTDFTHTHCSVPDPHNVKYILTGWYNFIE